MTFLKLRAGASGFWAKIPFLGSGLALAGSFSYGIYLVHQPYAIHFASFLKGQTASIAIPSLVLLVGALSLWGGILEKLLNAWFSTKPKKEPSVVLPLPNR